MIDPTGLFSESSLVAFGLGVVVTRCWYYAKDKWLDHCDPVHAPHHRAWKTIVMAWALILLVVGYVGFQAQEARDQTVALSQQVAECNRQFFSAQADRAKWGDDTDNWSNTKTSAIADWLRAIVTPPPDILALRTNNPNDPRYQEWAINTTSYFLGVIDNAQREQNVAIAQRAAHPLPKPTCGE